MSVSSKTPEITITNAQAEDLSIIAKLEEETFSGNMASLALKLDTLKSLFETFPEGIIVAKDKKTKELLGYACFERHRQKLTTKPIPYNHNAYDTHYAKGRYIYIDGFVVRDNLRGRGIGSRLLTEIESYAEREKIIDIYFLLEKNTLYHRTVTFWLNHRFTPTSMILNNVDITPSERYDGFVMERTRLAEVIAGGGVLITTEEALTDISRRVQGASLWMLSRQNILGFWGERSPWLTGIAIYTLAKSFKYHSDTIQKIILNSIQRAIDWLEGVQTDGGWDPQVGVWDTAIVLRGVLAAKKIDKTIAKEEMLKKGFSWLEMQVEEEQRLAESYEVSRYGLSYVAQAYLAFDDGGYTSGPKYAWMVDLCRREVEKLCEKRGFEVWGDHFNAPEILQAIIRYKDKEAEQKGLMRIQVNDKYWDSINVLLTWLEKTQSEYGSWGGLTWLTSMALDAYLKGSRIRYKKDKLERIGTVDYAIRWLVNQQYLEDFSWFHTPEETVYAIIALITVLEMYRTALYQIKQRVNESDIEEQATRVMRMISMQPEEIPASFVIPTEITAQNFARGILEDMGMQVQRDVYPKGVSGPHFEFVGEKPVMKGFRGSRKAVVRIILKNEATPITMKDVRDEIEWLSDNEKDDYLWLIVVSNVILSEDVKEFIRRETKGRKFKVRHYLVT